MVEITRSSLLSVTTACLCVIVVGVSTTTLELSLSTNSTPTLSSSQAPKSGLSLLALLYLLLNAILSLFGLSLNMKGGGAAGFPLINVILDSLQQLYNYRLVLIASLLLLIICVLGLKNHDQITLGHLKTPSDNQNTTPREQTASGWPRGKPSNDISKAWVEMVQIAEIDDPQVRTPRECQTAVIKAGFDPKAVKTITKAFVKVQYGNKAVPPVHHDRVQAALSDLLSTDGASQE